VSKLDTLFEKIDKSIALHQKNMDEADVFMESVLNDVFGELEEKYGLTVLSTVVKINSGIALPKIFKDKENTDGEVEFFKVAQMNNDTRVMKGANLNFTLSQSKEFKIKLFPKGSILIPKRGGAILTNKKRIMEREASYDSNVMGLKADNKILLDDFLFIFLKSIDLSNYIDTTTIPQVNNKHIDMMNISIPPLKIQEKIVTYVDEISQKIEKIKSVQKAKMQSLVALKASILDQAFRGEL
jgi:type I restriction enzyme S subunit